MNERRVQTDADVETLRQIRNSGRQWMTRDTHEITPEQQRAWWDALDHAGTKVWLFSESATDIGYGLVRLEQPLRCWCSLAVLPRYRGQHYGTQIYRWLALSQAGDVWAEILADNTPSLRAALRAGYTLASAYDTLAILVHKQ